MKDSNIPEVTSATFRDTFMEIKDVVKVRRYNSMLGTWIPEGKERPMDPVEKAIEPDKIKREPRGRLSKGLGDIDGREITDVKLVEVSLVEDTPENRAAGSHPITSRPGTASSFGYSRPAPKPGKK